MIPTIANIRKAIYCLNKRIDQLEGGDYQDNMVELSNKISDLESLISEDLQNPTSAIDKFNEIVTFLESIENTDTLSGLLGDIIAQIPTNVSDLENDSGYLTQHQDISGKLDKSEANITYVSASQEQQFTDVQKEIIQNIDHFL